MGATIFLFLSEASYRLPTYSKVAQCILLATLSFPKFFLCDDIIERKKLACNRPYGNERPSEKLRNYPFLPNKKDIRDVRRQLKEY